MYDITIQQGIENVPLAEDIREEVFVREQGFTKEIEIDEHDKEAYHVLICDNKKPVATARAFEEAPGVYHIGRVCVKKVYRGKGLGKELILQLEKYCKEVGAKKFTLGAQLHAESFYKNLGYRREGEEFLDEGQPHIEMVKFC